MTTPTIPELIKRVEKMKRPSRVLDSFLELYFTTPEEFVDTISPKYTGSINDALTLLPPRSCNALLMQTGRGWNFRFHDQDQLMGERAATEQIERMQCSFGSGYEMAGEARVVLEKAIASHFLEFYCMHAETAEGAIISAALKCKIRQDIDTELAASE